MTKIKVVIMDPTGTTDRTSIKLIVKVGSRRVYVYVINAHTTGWSAHHT